MFPQGSRADAGASQGGRPCFTMLGKLVKLMALLHPGKLEGENPYFTGVLLFRKCDKVGLVCPGL